jgi:AraC family transcriptional regulator, regulatory protein of adaptative response / methylated-DNA-[protein]-cysteine methyltransferase
MKLNALCTYGPHGKGAQIAFTLIGSPLGRVLLAGTKAGVCFIAIGDSDRALERELWRDFADAAIRRDDAAVGAWAREVVAYLAGRSPMPKVPLDVHGTPFQMRVWNELLAIPAGTTRSYGEIAERVGRRKASRAVGAAIGANPVSILIPCHRAVAHGGALHNYRWGVSRKRKLLELEGAPLASSEASSR